jgi:hypothetical protein
MHLPKRSCVVFVTLAGACATARYEPVAAAPVAAAPESAQEFKQGKPPPSELAPQPGAPQAAPAKAPRPPRLFADLTLAGGIYDHNTRADGSTLSGDTNGGFGRMRAEYIFERGIGGGISLEGSSSDDDLFGDNGGINVKGRTGDAFLFFVAEPSTDESFRIPMRVGPYFHTTTLDNDVTSLKTTWGGVGLRVEIEPEVWFLREDRFSFGIYGGGSGGVHATRVVLRGGGGNTTFDGDGATLGAEAGVQALWGRHVSTRFGYLYRVAREDESDSKAGISVPGATTSFSGLMLSVGVRF